MSAEDIQKVEIELDRFKERLKLFKDRASQDVGAYYGCKESGALKRSALDLKMELTRLTP